MTDNTISPLRRRMIEDMTIRKLAPKGQHDYVQRAKNFAAFLGRSRDTASFEDVRRYQLHLGVYRPSTRPSSHCASFPGSRSSVTRSLSTAISFTSRITSNAIPLRASALHCAAGLLASLPVCAALAAPDAARRQPAEALARRADAGTGAGQQQRRRVSAVARRPPPLVRHLPASLQHSGASLPV